MAWEPKKWRQGLLMGDSCLPESMRVPGVSAYLVISHDCDLARTVQIDPVVELLPCHATDIDKGCLNARHPRKLHFSIESGQAKINYEVRAYEKLLVKKQDISGTPNSMIMEALLPTLRSWLIARYRRQALPNMLDRGVLPFWDEFKKKSGDVVDSLHGVWVSFEPPGELENIEDGYNFICYFVYDTDKDPEGVNISFLVTILKDAWEDKLSKSSPPIFLELHAIPDSQFSYHMQRRTILWVHDYISYASGTVVDDI
jgi:hypothetical protein